jgi:hybrid cluster-associated redox disulfide protein
MPISKDMKVEEILTDHPELTRVFIEQGLPCLVCGEPFWGTIEELAVRYRADLNILIKRLNEDLDESQEKI